MFAWIDLTNLIFQLNTVGTNFSGHERHFLYFYIVFDCVALTGGPTVVQFTTFDNFFSGILVLSFFCFRMSRRVSTRRKRPPTRLDADSQPARRRQRVGQPPVESLPGPLSNVDDLVDKVANAVLMKLQGQHVFNHNTGNEDLLLSTEAPVVQASVVAEVDHSVISHTNSSGNDAASVSYLDQATTTAATVQGSVAAVLDGLTGTTSVATTPKDIFVSTNLPIDLNVSDRLKTKI